MAKSMANLDFLKREKTLFDQLQKKRSEAIKPASSPNAHWGERWNITIPKKFNKREKEEGKWELKENWNMNLKLILILMTKLRESNNHREGIWYESEIFTIKTYSIQNNISYKRTEQSE